MSSPDVPYAVQVGALVSEELLRLLSRTYDHALPISILISERELWCRNGQAQVLEFLTTARQQFLEHSNHRALVNPS